MDPSFLTTACRQALLLPYGILSIPFPTVPSANTWKLSDSWLCIKVYNSNGQVIVCGELSFLLWRTMGAFLLCPVGSAAQCRKHCLPKTPIFWGLLSSVMEIAISSSTEATDTYGVLGAAPHQEAVTFCVPRRSARMHVACILTINMKNSYMQTDYFCPIDPVKV